MIALGSRRIGTEDKMPEPGDEPRKVSADSIDDDDLDGLATESSGPRWVLRPAVQGGDSTCNTGWTLICETHPPGQTCTTGWTYKCDTGTCSWGWTFICDRRP